MARGIIRGERGPYQVYSDGSDHGDRAADLVLERAEHDFAQLCQWFGTIRPPQLPLVISCVPDPGGEPRSAAFHAGCGATEVEIAIAQPDAAPFLAATQLVEAFAAGSGGWSCLLTPGEALSQTLAFELYPEQAPRWNAEIASWLDNGRPDFITRNGRNTDLAANGCGNLFLRWLHYQLGFDWPAIIQAGCQASCLGDVYQQLTGASAGEGEQRFRRLLAAYFPAGKLLLLLTHRSPFPVGEALCTLIVLGLYESALGAPADPLDLIYWLEQLHIGSLSLEELAEAFLRSPGFQQTRITAAYRRLLHREPTAEELAACVADFTNHGGSQEALWLRLLLSEEYTVTHPSGGSFVRGIYQDILGTTPDVAALNVWVSTLEAGSSRRTLLESFLIAPVALDAALDATYARVLHRDPDLNLRPHYLARMAAGAMGRDDLLLTLLQSRALRLRLARDFISALCWSVLNRPPTARERDDWTAEIIEAGIALGALTQAFLESPEYLRRRVREAAIVLLKHALPPKQEEVLAAKLQAGSLRIEQLWIDLILSPEYARRTEGNTAFVSAVYRDILGREPDPDELEHARATLAANERLSFVRDLLASEAYLGAYVRAGYRRFLGREPDPQTELPRWISTLIAEGPDLRQFEQALLNSNGFRYRAITFRPT
jgi:hypothetical protein